MSMGHSEAIKMENDEKKDHSVLPTNEITSPLSNSLTSIQPSPETCMQEPPISPTKVDMEPNYTNSNPLTTDQRRTSRLPPRKPVEIRFLNLSYQVKEGPWYSCRKGNKEILHSLKGGFSSHCLSGILGPSGAGKSSLMNVLSGHKLRGMTGKITVNGNPRSNSTFRKLSCYIMQDDRLLQQFTVMESMMVSAHLNLSKTTSRNAKLEAVDEVLLSLDLISCKETKVGTLSGGQRKRLAIAVELINNPPVMFFDEPTSGLDSSTSFQVVKHLKSLAVAGKNVICTIHQPSAKLFEMFDWLYIMASGNCVYEGIVPGLLPFLAARNLNCPQYHNPADYVIEVASGEHGDQVPLLVQDVKDGKCGLETMRSSDSFLIKKQIGTRGVYSDLEVSKCKTFNTTELNQFWVLLKRTFIGIIRDQLLTHIRFVSNTSIGVLIGLLFLGIGNDAEKVLENAGFLFFSVMFVVFAALMPTVLTFPLELSVLLREHMNCWYSLGAYYAAKTLADVPFQIIFPFLYSLIVYFMTSQPYDPVRFFSFCFWIVLISVVAQSLGLVIGASSTSVEVATFVGPISTIPVFLFTGFFVRFNTIPYYLKWIGYTAYVRYGFEGVVVSIYGFNRTKLDCMSTQEAVCQFSDPEFIMNELDVDEANLLFDALVMVVFMVGLRIIGFFILKIRVRIEK